MWVQVLRIVFDVVLIYWVWGLALESRALFCECLMMIELRLSPVSLAAAMAILTFITLWLRFHAGPSKQDKLYCQELALFF